MISKRKYLLFAIGLLLVVFSTQRCANAVAPTGGPKDSTPPVAVEAVPENHSVGFMGKKIEITFDEYVTLENANQNMLFSPPLKEKPDIKLKNKTVVIKFKESLEVNTTYTIDFGAAIKDLHEGNQLKDYVFSFSTGDYLDTLRIAGKVLSAADKKPVESVYVGLYAAERDNLDSLPMTVAPNYLTKTDKEGNFRFEGLADKDYLVFALKDANSNLYFDLPNEEVAFLDTLVSAAYPQSIVNDTTVSDTLERRVFDQKALGLTLYMFTEVDSTQVLLEKKLVEEGLLRFVFRHPAKGAVIMTPEMLPDTFNLITMPSADHDTVLWYFTPNVKDSLWVSVKLDTLINDSSRYSLKFKDKKARNKKPESLKVSNNLQGKGGLVAGEDFILKFSEPVVSCQMSDSAVFKRDTIATFGELRFEQADEYGMKYRLLADIEEDVSYHIEIPDSVFFSIRGRTNSPIKVDFHRMKDDEFGNIYITVVPPEGVKQVVVQLTNEGGKVMEERRITKQEEVVFEHLQPAKYKLRAILDTDGNGKWSTGSYHFHRQPETIVDYKDVLEIRAGWDIDLEDAWEL